MKVARYIGGAGTGKTRLLMDRLAAVLDAGVHPLQVGFVSFTRAARAEAAGRAAKVCGMPEKQLTEDGWFRTLHSVCYRVLQVNKGQMITDNKESSEWLTEHVGISQALDSEDGMESFRYEPSDLQALTLWAAARVLCVSLDRAAEVAWSRGCEAFIDHDLVRKYERAKRIDGRLDFTDLLLRVAGVRYDDNLEPHDTAPEGDMPAIHTWFFDEQQDTSPLLDRVCKRLVESATWVYIVGDPFQAIYGFAGSDGGIFQQWDVDHQEIMPKSWRCGRQIHRYGEGCLRMASDYWDRGIEPADHDGAVEWDSYGLAALRSIDLTQGSWLVLARTNYLARKAAARVAETGLPWAPTKGNGGWLREKWLDACIAAVILEEGRRLNWGDWKTLISKLPAKWEGEQLIARGYKAKITRGDYKPDAETVGLDCEGVTDQFAELAQAKQLTWLIPDGVRVRDLYDREPEKFFEWAKAPPIRVGTIHSVKGAEADNVIWLTESTRRIADACHASEAVHNEECRVAYVAATRARHRLIVAEPPPSKKYRMPTP